MSMRVDIWEWQQAVREFKDHSRRTYPEIINRSAGSVSLKALMNTRRANADAIRDALIHASGVDYRQIKRGAKAGRFRAVVQKEFSNLAYALVRKQNPSLTGKALDDEVKKFVGRRIRSVGFLASGWLPAIAQFRNFMKGASTGGLRPRGKSPLGTALRATATENPYATVENFVGARNPQAVAAFSTAIQQEAGQLRAETARRMQTIADRQAGKQ